MALESAWLRRCDYHSAEQGAESALEYSAASQFRGGFPTLRPLLEPQSANLRRRFPVVRCATMTKPIEHRPLRRAGRKPTKPPAGALDQVRELAADGWSVIGIAHRLGTDPKTFNLWLEREPALQDAFALGREQERHALHNMLFRRATEKGDVNAAMALLRARHGYAEGHGDQGNRVNVTIALPGAMTLAQFNAIGTKGSDNAQGN
jgi:hypothetical protein